MRQCDKNLFEAEEELSDSKNGRIFRQFIVDCFGGDTDFLRVLVIVVCVKGALIEGSLSIIVIHPQCIV